MLPLLYQVVATVLDLVTCLQALDTVQSRRGALEAKYPAWCLPRRRISSNPLLQTLEAEQRPQLRAQRSPGVIKAIYQATRPLYQISRRRFRQKRGRIRAREPEASTTT